MRDVCASSGEVSAEQLAGLSFGRESPVGPAEQLVGVSSGGETPVNAWKTWQLGIHQKRVCSAKKARAFPSKDRDRSLAARFFLPSHILTLKSL